MANKIFIVTGPREGVGKTTLAANLAARMSQLRRQPVILIDTDPACQGETAQIAGGSPTLNVATCLEQLASKQMLLPMFRGRVPINRLGIGVMNLAGYSKQADQISNDQFSFFLQAFSQLYDLV